MQNSDKLIKGKSPLARVVENFAYVNTNNEMLFLDYGPGHRIRSIQNDQQAIRDSSVIFVAPYWSYRISCLKVQLAPLAQGADSEK